MRTTMWLRRRSGDRGATLVLFAISLTAITALAGVCIDGGRAYGLHRQMQNAADASAMAGGRALDLYNTGQTTDVTVVYNAARTEAQKDGADVSGGSFTCELLDFSRTTVLGACPTSSGGSIPNNAAAVRVGVRQTEPTFFARVTGLNSYTATSSAASLIGKPTAGNAPFLMCANAVGAVPNILLNQGTQDNPVWVVNPAAIGTDYNLYGNDIKDLGRDCGDGSSSFRGLIDNKNGPYPIPGWWATLTGNKNGPTLAMINSGDACSGEFDSFGPGCKLVLPLCVKGTEKPGKGFEVYCVDLGLFRISSVSNHDINGVFLGHVTVSQTGIGGPADPNGARVIQLVE